MATQLKKTVKPSGGDYTSLEACMNANEQNLVTADQYFNVEIDGSWSSADTSAVTIHNYTTDATRYINIYTTAAARHDGKEKSVSGLSNYVLSPTDSWPITLSVNYTTIDGIEITVTFNSEFSHCYGIYCGIENVGSSVIKNCILHDIIHSHASSTRGAYGIYNNRYLGQVYNCILYNISAVNTGGGTGIYSGNEYGGLSCLNNTIYNVESTGISSAASGYLVKNCLVITAATCYSGGTLTTCGSSDATGSAGLQSLTTSEFINTSAGSEDLHLASGATSINAGTDLSATFTTDIDGTTRPTGAGTWDIGADEYVAAGPSPIPAIAGVIYMSS